MSGAIIVGAIVIGAAWVIVTALKEKFEFRIDFKDDDR